MWGRLSFPQSKSKLYKTCDDLLKETPVGAVTVIDEANPENNKNNIEVGEDLDGMNLIKKHNSTA